MRHEHGQNCRELLGFLSDYIDGSLQGELCGQLESHLAGCVDCQVVMDTLRKTIELYEVDRTEEIPEEVKLRLYKRLDLEDLLTAG